MIKFLTRATLVLSLTVFGCVSSFAQKDKAKADRPFDCQEWHNDKLVNNCEIREQTLPATGETLTVDGRRNGGISIKGWERKEILLRSRVQSVGTTEAEAKEMATQVKIETANSKIFATGPESKQDYWWTVSYEIYVPLRSNLSLKTTNGGISIVDVSGRMEFSALNGGVSLKHVGGDVHGGTTNGGVHIELTGDRWDGEALDVNTTNGGVSLKIPENYSAHLETGTVNGSVNIDFPFTNRNSSSREFAFDLGSGGSTIRAKTVNGGVRIYRNEGARL